MLSKKNYDLLIDAIKERKNILVAGGTSSGKTTFTNALISSIVEIYPKDRLILIEDTNEIQCKAKNKVIMRSYANADLLRLLKSTLRFRPDRIIVGEVRGGEALSLLKAWNTGHPGGIATIHANSAKAALVRLEQLIAEVSPSDMRSVIAEGIDLVVFLKKTTNGRKVKEVIEVIGFDEKEKTYILKENENE